MPLPSIPLGRVPDGMLRFYCRLIIAHLLNPLKKFNPRGAALISASKQEDLISDI